MSTNATSGVASGTAASAAAGLVHARLPQRIRFGAGSSATQLPAELRHLSARRVLIMSSARDADAVSRISRRLHADQYQQVTVLHDRHPGLGDIDAFPFALSPCSDQADVVVTVGGNGDIDRAKLVSAILTIPFIAIPTTYSASELDARFSLEPPLVNQRPQTSPSVPAAVIYDPCLTFALSPRQTGVSLLGAIGSGVETLASTTPGSAVRVVATQGLRELARASLDAVYCPDSLPARSIAQFGAYLTGAAAAAAQTNVLRAATCELARVTGTGLAETRAALVLQYVGGLARVRPDVHAELVAAWQCADPSAHLSALAAACGAARELSNLSNSTPMIAAIARHYNS